MNQSIPNPLKESEQPYFFKVADKSKFNIDNIIVRKGDAVRTVVRSLSHMQKEALVYSHLSDSIWRLASDEGAYLMGHDECPAPLTFLTVGMVSSYMNEIIALATIRQIKIKHIKLRQDNYYTMQGSLRKKTMIGGALPIELVAEIDSDTDKSELQKLVFDATIASPLNGMLTGKNESLFKLSHNGSEIQPKGVKELNTDIYDEKSIDFAKVKPEENKLDEAIILKKGQTKITKQVTSSKGSSLKDSQQRILHLSGICALRSDGVKIIEQHLYNPHGSIFRFLSEEGKGNRAPDANSYISAGIGFCFMTQFGRYAKMMKTNMQHYSIIQDTHFSLGGATGKTGKPGTADPVETHVYFHSGDSDEVAQETLFMSEQTCFLHALCRTDLKPKIKVRKL